VYRSLGQRGAVFGAMWWLIEMPKSSASRSRRRRETAAARAIPKRFWGIKVMADVERVVRL